VCGALDPVSLRAANALVGNAASTACLEAAYMGPTLTVETQDVRLAVVGAKAPLEILESADGGGGCHVGGMRSVTLRQGETLRIGALTGRSVLYIAVEGGFDIEPVLGSLSTDLRGRFGGFGGRALVAGDRLPLRQARASTREEVELDGLDLDPPARIRVIAGPQNDYFSEAETAAFFAGDYTVGAGSDRMGMRLIGRPLRHVRDFNIVSDAIAPGSIQVPGNGQPIVLLADRQTTGGYPKIATVISADLPALSRLSVGGKVAFAPVTVEEAEAARRRFLADLEGIRLVPLRRTDVTAQLHDCNLISGVVNAAA
jgi:biotin-dependent carboxylase-like uncharacterized protein